MPAQAHLSSADYKAVYAARNGAKDGATLLYIATGYKKAPREVHAFYRNGFMWHGCGKNIQEALDGAIEDGWLYARS